MTIALVLLDIQNDFVLPGAPLCVPKAQGLLPNMKELLNMAREEQWPVFHVTREHRLDGADVEIARTYLFAAGFGACIKDSPGTQIVDELTPAPGEYLVKKRRFSAFMCTELQLLLSRLQVNTLVVAGLQYPTSIRATAMDAVSLDYYVIVATDACAASTPEVEQANITDLCNIGVFCVPVAQVQPTLKSLPLECNDRLSDC